MKALIVDESRAMRTLLGRNLRKIGFDVFEAKNAEDALDFLESMPAPAVILVEWKLPNMDGLELVQKLRSNSAFGEMKIVMVTSETEPERLGLALESGVDEYIMKPFEPEALVQRMKMLGLESGVAS